MGMHLQNRVTPFSDLERSEARGMYMGNRGRLHDADRNIVRQRSSVKSWVCCALSFKGRKRVLMSPNSYTELFFLDEATAFAAGHRPCGECRRTDYNRFKEAWASAFGNVQLASVMNARIFMEQTTILNGAPRQESLLSDLPFGTMVERRCGGIWLHHNGHMSRWTHAGYSERVALNAHERVSVITCPTLVEILRHGYKPVIHDSAF